MKDTIVSPRTSEVKPTIRLPADVSMTWRYFDLDFAQIKQRDTTKIIFNACKPKLLFLRNNSAIRKGEEPTNAMAVNAVIKL